MTKHAWDYFDEAPHFALVKDSETVTVRDLLGCYPHDTPFITADGERFKPTDLVFVDDRIKVTGVAHRELLDIAYESEDELCGSLNEALREAGITPGEDIDGEEFSYAAAIRKIAKQRDAALSRLNQR